MFLSPQICSHVNKFFSLVHPTNKAEIRKSHQYIFFFTKMVELEKTHHDCWVRHHYHVGEVSIGPLLSRSVEENHQYF